MKYLESLEDTAILLRFSDHELQKYMQGNPYLAGQDETLNKVIFDQILENFVTAQAPVPVTVGFLEPGEDGLLEPVAAKVEAMLSKIGLGKSEIAEIQRAMGWKFIRIPANAAHILVLGCGGGIELIFLRAAAPEARIVAVDWSDKLLPGVREVAAIEFEEDDLLRFLADCAIQFDVVFSNHVLEHLYDPDQGLRLIRRAVQPAGMLASCLPLDASHGMAGQLAERVRRGLGRLDLGLLDLGHPWKTTAPDVHQRIINSGFTQVDLIQRANRTNVLSGGTQAEMFRRYDRGKLLHSLAFHPLKLALTVFGLVRPAEFMIHLFYAVQRRVWFGECRLKNECAPELLVLAR